MLLYKEYRQERVTVDAFDGKISKYSYTYVLAGYLFTRYTLSSICGWKILSI